ncbi:MAG: hypothetical protein ACRD5G_13740 [Candidatus Acidiferrales bacterium]
MKRLTLLLSVLLVTGLVFAAGQAAQQQEQQGKSHKVKAEVVSTDATNNTLTFKMTDGQEMTSPVQDQAQQQLASLSPGDKVTLTCQDDANGEHRAIVAIQKAPATAKP